MKKLLLVAFVAYAFTLWAGDEGPFDQSVSNISENGEATDSTAVEESPAEGEDGFSQSISNISELEDNTGENADEEVSTTADDGNFSQSISNISEVATAATEDNAPVFKLFPNPATDLCTVQGLDDQGYAVLLDVRGTVVDAKFGVSGSLVVFDLTGLPEGVYFVSVAGATERLIVK